MKVRQIQLKNVTVLKEATVDIPSTGITLVVGKNGNGKSTLLEAVSQVMYDKNLRGVGIWAPNKAGSAEVSLEGGVVAKRQSTRAGKKSFTLTVNGQEVEAPTATKASSILESLLPDHEVWSNCCYISPETVSRFSHATDKHRKALLERLLGLSYLDKVLKLCTEDLRKAEAAANQKHTNLLRVQSQVSGADGVLRALRETKPVFDAGLIEAARQRYKEKQKEVVELQEKLKSAEDDDRAALEAVRKLDQEIQNIERVKTVLESELRNLLSQKKQMGSGVCPTCGQKTPGKDTGPIDARIAEKQKQLDEDPGVPPLLVQKRLEASKRYEENRNSRLEENQKLATAKSELAHAETEGRRLKSEQDKAASFDTRLKEAEAALVKSQACEHKANEDHLSAVEEVDTLKLVQEAVGIRGFRTSLFDDALSAVQDITNSWIAEVFPGEVSTRIFRKGDKICFEVDGVGGGLGYKALSTGERRRFDVCLLLAFGELARRSTKMDSVTIFADEPFENLDAQGQEAIAYVLRQFAEKHSVVVITHNSEFARLLQPVACYRAEKGTYRREF